MVCMTSRRSFAHRAETFGYDGKRPWAHQALRLVTATPRVYKPLADAWDRRYPGTHRALRRLVDAEFLAYQPPVIINTRTGASADRESPKVDRFRLTAKGRRLRDATTEDLRALEDTFPNLTDANVKDVARLLSALDLDGSHAKYGLSTAAAIELTTFSDRSGRWWVKHLVATGHAAKLDVRLPDTREVIPAHWRATRLLCRQLTDVLDEYDPNAATIQRAWRLKRRRFLDDVDPARIGISGATDFDHDIEAQQLLVTMLRSPNAVSDNRFVIEPRLSVPADTNARPWQFDDAGGDTIFYQPDAELQELRDGTRWRTVLEYERYQSRRDAWSHIERLLGYLGTTTLPFESAVLRFVLDGDARVRSYVQLIEGFAAYSMDHPEAMPGNRVLLMVSSSDRLAKASDPLDDRVWFRIPVASPSEAGVPVLHPPKASPYEDYVLG